MSYKDIKTALQSLANPDKKNGNARFFKTGEGEYAYGDIFINVSNPQLHQLAKKYKDTPLSELEKLLQDPIHEARLLALFILVLIFEKGDMALKKSIYELYLKNTKFVNNWDLVDSSAHKIVGAYLLDKNTELIYDLSKSNDLWEERIAMIATAAFIKKGIYEHTINLSIAYLNHKHDLIHKASGWMLREVGKKDEKVLLDFLQKYTAQMPRTMYRYAIEKLNPKP